MNGMFKTWMPWFEADAAGSGGGAKHEGSGAGDNANGEGETLTFEAWSETLPPEQKGLIESHTKGLKSALESERESRKGLEKQLRDLAKAQTKGSEAEAQLTGLANELQASDRKADFYEAAHAAGVKNLKLAYTAAVNDEMFDKHGRVNFVVMKEAYPELFAVTSVARGDAGSGTEKKPKPGAGMNDFIRTTAGKK